jgi:peptidoglycan/LPS O-acetylase OafA/YrhL
MCPMMLISAILMFIVANLGNTPGLYYPMIIIVGMFLGGPYNLVAAACSMDLAK